MRWRLCAVLVLGLMACDDETVERADASADTSADAMPDVTDAMPDAMPGVTDATRDAMPWVTDAIPDAMPDMIDAVPDAMPVGPSPIRAPCFIGQPTDTGLDPAPTTCFDIFAADPDAETGCSLFDDGADGFDEGYCWRRRALLLLVNNNIEAEASPDDLDGDGVIDQGPRAGENHPRDPLEATPGETAARLTREIRSWYREVSYDSVWLDAADVYVVPESEHGPARWFRLQQLRPGFAHPDLFREVCRQRGGMTPADWRAYDFIVTIITDGTATSGSQKRTESLPVGPDCDETVDIRGDYIVAKRFASWSRLGTLFHELGHGLSRDPLDEPSIGHSEATHALEGTHAEYGDLTDVMGESSNRGHFSLAQKGFMRLLPADAVIDVPLDAPLTVATLHPIERNVAETKGLVIRVDEGRSYYVETRRAIGADIRLPSIFHQGALVKRANAVDGANKSWIVDPTPETPTVRSDDSVLLPGRTFADPENRLYITALAHDADGTRVEVRRGPPSAAPPIVEDIDAGADGLTLSVSARAGDPTVADDALLYFWKIGPLDGVTSPTGWREGPSVRLAEGALGRELWLLVSDRRGGETWTQVRPAP